MISIRKGQFLREVSTNSGGVDLETVKRVYYGVVNTMSKQLKARHVITLPDWGSFSLRIHKARLGKEIRTNKARMFPAYGEVKFVPFSKLKAFFRSLGEEGL